MERVGADANVSTILGELILRRIVRGLQCRATAISSMVA